MQELKLGERVKVKVSNGFFEGIIEEMNDKMIVVKFLDSEIRVYAKREDVRKLNINKFTE